MEDLEDMYKWGGGTILKLILTKQVGCVEKENFWFGTVKVTKYN
jgi:hypothetical protein